MHMHASIYRHGPCGGAGRRPPGPRHASNVRPQRAHNMKTMMKTDYDYNPEPDRLRLPSPLSVVSL